MTRHFVWTDEKRMAFARAWEGHSARQIAEELHTTRRTVEGWQRRLGWRQRMRRKIQRMEAYYAAKRRERVQQIAAQHVAWSAERGARDWRS
jgi:hypothetical protein